MRRILVTGAGTRIGQHICLGLAEAGFHVIIHFNRSVAGGEQTMEQIKSLGGSAEQIQADLSDQTRTAALLDEIANTTGPVRALINNASIFEPDEIQNLDEQQWDQHFAVNLKAPVLLTRGFASQLPKGQTGHVINLLDQRISRLNPTFFSYTLSKSALATATVTMAQSLAPHIRVNAVAPGPTLRNARQSRDDFLRQCQASLLQIGSEPEEITRSVLFLLNSKAITGQIITVDGGQHLNWQTPDIVGIGE